MKRLLLTLAALLAAFGATAQIRTYDDLDVKSFVIGLDNYFFGDPGALEFSCGGAVSVEIAGGKVTLTDGETALEIPHDEGSVLVGIHDFTGDNVPEVVVASRGETAVSAVIYQKKAGAWEQIGRIGAPDASEIRVFRQAMTIRPASKDVLYSWTFHGKGFDFKSSDGGADPTSLL